MKETNREMKTQHDTTRQDATRHDTTGQDTCYWNLFTLVHMT